MHEIGVREVVQFAGWTFNWETLVMTWITMAIVLLIAVLATRNLQLVPTGWQNVVEAIVVWLHEYRGWAFSRVSGKFVPLEEWF